MIFSHGTQDPWSFLTKKNDSKHWSVVIVEVEGERIQWIEMNIICLGGAHASDIGLSCTIADDYCSDNVNSKEL